MSETVKTLQISQIEVLASGLDSPRKLSFGPDGALYVAEAGRGGTGTSIPSPSQPGASVFYGATGAITRIQNRLVRKLQSQTVQSFEAKLQQFSF
jgi:glucose/arabinose dehydrogenase